VSVKHDTEWQYGWRLFSDNHAMRYACKAEMQAAMPVNQLAIPTE
jgi:hypothetical protein